MQKTQPLVSTIFLTYFNRSGRESQSLSCGQISVNTAASDFADFALGDFALGDFALDNFALANFEPENLELVDFKLRGLLASFFFLAILAIN